MNKFKSDFGPIHYFESPLEVLNTIDETIKSKGVDSLWISKVYEGSRSFDQSDKNWAGGSYQDLKNDLENGNKKLIVETDEKVGELLNKNYLEDQFFMDIEGFSYDMGALNSGEPEYCLNRVEEKPRKVLDILIDPSYNGSNNPDVLVARGAAIVKFATGLKNNNYIVNSYIFETTNAHYKTNHEGSTSFELIRVNDEFNLINQIATVSNTKFFRAGLIMLSGICNGELRDPGSAQGYWPSGDEWKKELSKNIPTLTKEPFFIGGGYNWREMNQEASVDKCYEFILKRFEEYQKGLTDEN